MSNKAARVSNSSGAPPPKINIKRNNTLHRKARKVLQSNGYEFYQKWADQEFRISCPSQFRDMQAEAERQGKTKVKVKGKVKSD